MSIRESVDDVKFTLLLTVVLVVLVIFLFLRNLSATIIPSLALPFSIVGTFAVMWALGYSLDNLSLMALTLSVGFVVDDAIVMLENIVRHMEMGKPRMQAALDGSKEIAFTIVSMTLSLAAVFIPILFMGGIVGRLMHEFAVTIGAAILVSGLVSLTLTPMLCSRFLKPPHAIRHGRLYNAIERVFDAWLNSYALDAEADDPVQGHHDGGLGLLLVGTVYLFRIVPTGFIPSVDTGQMSGRSRPSRASASTTDRRAQAGSDGHPGERSERRGLHREHRRDGRRPAEHRPQAARPADADGRPDHRGAAAEARAVPGVRVFLTNPPAIRIGGMQSRSAVPVRAAGSRHRGAVSSSRRSSRRRCATSPGCRTSTPTCSSGIPQLSVDLDREQIAALGLTVDQVQSALSRPTARARSRRSSRPTTSTR